MKNVIVASIKEESKAIEALHKLNKLDSFGDITVYDQIMDAKNAPYPFRHQPSFAALYLSVHNSFQSLS